MKSIFSATPQRRNAATPQRKISFLMKTQILFLMLFLNIVAGYAQNCYGFTQFFTIDPQNGAIPQCTPVNCTLNLCNYTSNGRNILVYIKFDTSFEFFNSGDFVLDNDPNNPTQVRLRLLTTNLQSGCTDFRFQIRSLGGTGHINGEVQFPNSNCSPIAIPSRFMVSESVSVVGVDGQTTNISSSFPGLPFNILVRGTVVLDQGTNGNTYVINGLSTSPAFIALDRNASLIIPNNKGLVISDASIFGCANKWESIVIENGGGMEMTRSSVKDGRRAIVARNGAYLDFKKDTFTDNVTSIFTDYSSQTQNMNASILGCYFRGTGQLKPDNGTVMDNAIPTSGIEIHHTVGLNVLGLNASTGPIPSVFENLSTGIEALHSIINVGATLFRDMIPTQNGSGIGIMSNGYGSSLYHNGYFNSLTNFSNCEVGIASGNALDLIIERTVMNNVHQIGISVGLVASNNFVDIHDNSIYYSKIGIRSLWNSIGRSGQIVNNKIYNYADDGDVSNSYAIRAQELTYSGNWQIRKNTLSGDNGRGGITYNRGNNAVIAENTIIGGGLFDSKSASFGGTTNSTIRCNYIAGSQNGQTAGLYLSTGGGNMISCNNVDGMNRGFDFLGMSNNTDFKGNTMNGTTYGLQIQDNSYIGVQSHKGNLFSGPFFNGNSDGAIHLSGDLFTIGLSRFRIDPNFNASFCPFPSGCNGNNWFTPEANSSPFQCNTGNPSGTCPLGVGGFAAPSQGGLNEQLMSNRSSAIQNPNLLWMGQKQLYESLLNNQDLLATNRPFSNFVNEQARKSIGKYYAIQNNVREIGKRAHEMTNSVGAKAEENRNLVKEVSGLIEKCAQTTDKTEKKKLQEQIKTLNGKIAENHTYNLAKLAESESVKNRAIDQLITENDKLEAQLQVEKNTKAVMHITLEVFKGSEAKLTAEQIRILEPIANQCPIDGGESVYEARSLLGAVENKYYDDALLCRENNALNSVSNGETQALKTTVTKAKALTFNVSPNPAKDILDIVYNNSTDENTEGVVKIINALGAVVLTQKVVNNGQNRIDTSTLRAGIYLVRLQVGGNTQVQKVTILK